MGSASGFERSLGIAGYALSSAGETAWRYVRVSPGQASCEATSGSGDLLPFGADVAGWKPTGAQPKRPLDNRHD